MTSKRITTMVFLVASTGLLLCGALILPWWAGPLEGGSFEIDLRGMTMCLDAVCGGKKPLSVADASGVAWAKIGTSTFAASLVAAALLMLCIGQTIRGAKRGTLHWIAGLMVFFTGVLALLFVWLRPDFGEWTPSYGLACALAGSLVGIAAVSMAARVATSESN